MKAHFIGEPIEPVAGTMDAGAMARGEPGLPQRFVWRGREYSVEAVLETWKETSDCRSGSGERYVRKHGFRIRTGSGEQMRIYCDRQARSRGRPKARWWLYALLEEGAEEPGEG